MTRINGRPANKEKDSKRILNIYLNLNKYSFTGADMTVTEKTNNVSVDQIAAKVSGHHTRYPSLVMGTEGGTGSYGSAKTLSHYGPGRPIP